MKRNNEIYIRSLVQTINILREELVEYEHKNNPNLYWWVGDDGRYCTMHHKDYTEDIRTRQKRIGELMKELFDLTDQFKRGV